MKKSFIRATRIAAVATAFCVASVEAENYLPAEDALFNAESSGVRLPVETASVQPQTEPTVGGTPFFKPLEFRGTAELRGAMEGKETKEAVPSERHWKFLLGLTVGGDYDDNIFLEPRGSREDDFIWAFAPTVGIQVGDMLRGSNYFLLTYTPTFVVFTDHSDNNSVEHAVDLKFVRQTDIWKFSSNFDFMSLNGASDPLRDISGNPVGENIGERVDRQLYTLGLDYNYKVSDKTSIDLGFSGTGVHYLAFLDTVDLVSQDYLDFAVSDKTSIGLGVGIGYAKTEGSRNQIYEQPLARFRYLATSKLAFEVHGGAEFRQIDGGGDAVNGIFGLSLDFVLSERTSFNLSGYRNVNPASFEANSDYTTTGVRATVAQQVHGKLYANLAIGYENSQYHSIGDNVLLQDRTDDYFYVRPSIQYQLGGNGAVEVFYEYRSNDSTYAFDQFDNNRVGFRIGFAY